MSRVEAIQAELTPKQPAESTLNSAPARSWTAGGEKILRPTRQPSVVISLHFRHAQDNAATPGHCLP